MGDEEIRSKQRAGRMDLAAILRASADAPAREALVRLAAGLGHEEARRWTQELGLKEIESFPGGAWKALPLRRQLEWVCDCAEVAIGALERAGGSPGEGSPAALALLRGRSDGAGADAREAQRVSELLVQEGRAFRRAWDDGVGSPEAMDVGDCAYLGERLASAMGDLVQASGQADGLERRVRDALQSFELLAAEAELVALGGSLLEAHFGREPRREKLREEHRAWRLAHLRDAYLWPEAIRC